MTLTGALIVALIGAYGFVLGAALVRVMLRDPD